MSRIPQAIEELERVRDNILGSPEDMTLEKPTANSEGILVGGSHFERLGQDGVKNTRCVSLTMSHQHAKNRVGPTAGSKMYNSELSENEIIRCDTVKVCCFLDVFMYAADKVIDFNPVGNGVAAFVCTCQFTTNP